MGAIMEFATEKQIESFSQLATLRAKEFSDGFQEKDMVESFIDFFIIGGSSLCSVECES